MTHSELITKKARLFTRFCGVIALPGIITLFVAWLGGNSGNLFVQWCSLYWWQVLLYSLIPFVLISVITSFLLRCPFCNFRFSRAGITKLTLAFDTAAVKYCPQRGGSFDQVAHK